MAATPPQQQQQHHHPQRERILCLSTGGSIDKTYSGEASDFIVGKPTVRSVLGLSKCNHAVTYREICRKDSLAMTDVDREAIATAMENAHEKLVVVVHGTDTMAATAKYLKERAKAKGKVVVITGAMRPEAFKDSDAAFNLGSAFAVAPFLTPGAHVVMHGAVFSRPETIVKDVKRDVITTAEALAARDARDKARDAAAGASNEAAAAQGGGDASSKAATRPPRGGPTSSSTKPRRSRGRGGAGGGPGDDLHAGSAVPLGDQGEPNNADAPPRGAGRSRGRGRPRAPAGTTDTTNGATNPPRSSRRSSSSRGNNAGVAAEDDADVSGGAQQGQTTSSNSDAAGGQDQQQHPTTDDTA